MTTIFFLFLIIGLNRVDNLLLPFTEEFLFCNLIV